MSSWLAVVVEHRYVLISICGAMAFAVLVYRLEMSGGIPMSIPQISMPARWRLRRSWLMFLACFVLVSAWAFTGNAQTAHMGPPSGAPFIVATSGFEDLVSIANKLGGVSFATLLLIILYGSWKNVWRWSRDFTELEARLSRECKLLSDDRDFWRNTTMRITGIAEAQGEQLMVVASQISTLNKKIPQQHDEP